MTAQEIGFAIQENAKMAAFFLGRNAEGDSAKAAQCLAWNKELLTQASNDASYFDNI